MLNDQRPLVRLVNNLKPRALLDGRDWLTVFIVVYCAMLLITSFCILFVG